jgi:D-serine deaminase-like pyridoxal phosphate-dependent protein
LSKQAINRRRRALVGAALLAPVAAAVALKPHQHGGAHSEAFLRMQAALRDAELYRPTLVIDRAALLHNIGRLKANLPSSKHYRIVAKSLPSLELIRLVRQQTGTERLMVFHQPFLNLVAREMPDAHLLVGKPMPIGAASRFFEHLTDASGFDSATQIDWLIDTPQRLREYRELAQANAAAGSAPMRVNLELDIGLHRGGFRTTGAVAEAIRALKAEPSMRFSGFMGYEAHASKMPGILGGPQKALDKAMAQYADCVDVARESLGADFDPDRLVLNAGGSSTYELYTDASPCNEVSMGSGLVMPTDFDKPTLADHQPAAYIATPVIKALDRTELPGLEPMTGLFAGWDPNTARTFYTYGGYWHADVISPPGLQHNAIWGHSTNQEMLNGSEQVQLAVDDFVFYRPHQSEFVFLQFGDIAVYDAGRIVDSWPVFTQGA